MKEGSSTPSRSRLRWTSLGLLLAGTTLIHLSGDTSHVAPFRHVAEDRAVETVGGETPTATETTAKKSRKLGDDEGLLLRDGNASVHDAAVHAPQGTQQKQDDKKRRGSSGEDGMDGKDGAKGDKGDKVEIGAPGSSGEDGSDGKDGARGSSGKDGADGEDGKGHSPPTIKSLPSRRWLLGPRLSNNDAMLTKHDVQTLIVDGARSPSILPIASSTICDGASRLATSPDFNYDATSVTDWSKVDAAQVMLRGIYENQYGPARREARARLKEWDAWEGTLYRASGEEEGSSDNISMVVPDGSSGSGNGTEVSKPIAIGQRVGLFDYECPHAKFLVFLDGWPKYGLGAALRHLGVTNNMKSGLEHGRVVLFLGKVPFASCPRGDLQCSFLPLSPCVLTQDEIDGAPRISRSKLKKYLADHPDERVVVSKDFKSTGGDAWVGIRQSMVRLYEAARRSRSPSRRRPTTEEERSNFTQRIDDLLQTYDPHQWKTDVAVQLFLTRPNGVMRETHRQIFEETFPPGFNSSRAIGMAIRGSDKCDKESQCLEFREYMQKAKSHIQRETNKTYEYILVTSEDRRVLEAQVEYARTDDWGLTYIMNKREVAQGVGSYAPVSGNVTAGENVTSGDDVMTMTMATWRLQMHVGFCFKNGCSHFAKLLAGTNMLGCGLWQGSSGYGVKCGSAVGGGMGRFR